MDRHSNPEPADDTEFFVSRVGDVLVFSVPALELPEALSESERSVAKALIAGYSNAEIARSRRTSSKTVANQLYGMYRKLGVGSRDELVALLVGGVVESR